ESRQAFVIARTHGIQHAVQVTPASALHARQLYHVGCCKAAGCVTARRSRGGERPSSAPPTRASGAGAIAPVIAARVGGAPSPRERGEGKDKQRQVRRKIGVDHFPLSPLAG